MSAMFFWMSLLSNTSLGAIPDIKVTTSDHKDVELKPLVRAVEADVRALLGPDWTFDISKVDVKFFTLKQWVQSEFPEKKEKSGSWDHAVYNQGVRLRSFDRLWTEPGYRKKKLRRYVEAIAKNFSRGGLPRRAFIKTALKKKGQKLKRARTRFFNRLNKRPVKAVRGSR